MFLFAADSVAGLTPVFNNKKAADIYTIPAIIVRVRLIGRFVSNFISTDRAVVSTQFTALKSLYKLYRLYVGNRLRDVLGD